MNFPYRTIIAATLVIAFVVALIALVNQPKDVVENDPQADTTEVMPLENPVAPKFKTITLNALDGVDPNFRLRASIPATWEVEAVPESKAISIFDPEATGESSLEQSQIFIKYFEASKFLTLQSVDVLERTELTINKHPAVRYRIAKKSGVANFPNQPSWRNLDHEVTDIRELPTTSPSIFYVIARNPEYAADQFDQFLYDLEFLVDDQVAASDVEVIQLKEPVEGFRERVTLKPFGIKIDPTSSPVQPERFAGYHTAADAEFTSTEDEARDIAVRAVADGTVTVSRTASGYGGVLAIRHVLNGETVFGIYGHLDPSSLKPVGEQVSAGEEIAILGDGFSTETDGERKHLHFALYRGDSPSLLGYVDREEDLVTWIDPLTLLGS